jgi:hypothetical protein
MDPILKWVESYMRLVGPYLDGGHRTGRHRWAVMASDRTEVTALLGPCGVSVTCSLLSEQACLAALDLSPFLPGVVTVERSCLLCVVRLRQKGEVVADPGLGVRPGSLGSVRPRSFKHSLADVSWAVN